MWAVSICWHRLFLCSAFGRSSMFKPETGERATMIAGDEEEVAAKIVDLLGELGKV